MAKYIHRVGAGKTRDYWEIKQWIEKKGFTVQKIAQSLDVHPSTVSQTIRGCRNVRRVLHGLLDMGCPASILSLPKDMMGAK